MNKKMLFELVMITIFFFAPCLATADNQSSSSQTIVAESATQASESTEQAQEGKLTEPEKVVAENSEVNISTPDMAETEGNVPQSETAPAEAEQLVTVEAENVTEAQAVAVTSLEDVKKTPSDFQIELWTDRNDGLYHIANDLVIYLKANKDSRVTLFDVGTSGKVHIIFPNEYQQDNLIKAGQTYRVPAEEAKWTFKIQGPAGKNILKAIATLENIQLLAQNDVKKVGIFQEVNKSESQLAKDISIALKPVDSMQWTETGAELTVLK